MKANVAELQPCPFCSYTPGPVLYATTNASRSVVCNHCGAHGPYADGDAGAREAWNRSPNAHQWEEADELLLARAEVLSLLGLLAELDRMEEENLDDSLGGYCGPKVADFKRRYREAVTRNGGVEGRKP